MHAFVYWLVLLLAILPARQAISGVHTIRIGVFPYGSAQQIIVQKEPLRRHLEGALRRPSTLETAPDLGVFIRRIAQSEYDIALMPANLGRLVQQDYGWLPLVKYVPDMEVYIVTRKHDGLGSLRDLKGKVLATADRALLLSAVADRRLRSHGVAEGDFDWLETGGLASSVYAVIAGQADAAVATQSSLALTPQSELDRLRVLDNAGQFPQPFVMLNPDASRDFQLQVLRACETFRVNGVRVFSSIQAKELKKLDAYAAQARMKLGLYREPAHRKTRSQRQ